MVRIGLRLCASEKLLPRILEQIRLHPGSNFGSRLGMRECRSRWEVDVLLGQLTLYLITSKYRAPHEQCPCHD